MPEHKKLVIASIPRTGSTLIYEHLGGVNSSDKIIHADRLIKTHGLAPPDTFNDPQAQLVHDALISKQFRALFLFGDPIHSVISTYKNIMDTEHFKNCGADNALEHIDTKAIFLKDILNYERMFDSWMQYHHYNVLAVRYETMQFYMEQISAFVGTDLTGIKFKERRTTDRSVKIDDLETIRSTYKSLTLKTRAHGNLTYWGMP